MLKHIGYICGGLLMVGAISSARAGSVITTNLAPGNVAIANVDARADGAQLTSQAVWRSPFSTTATLPTVTLSPGSYYFRVVNPTDALALNPSLTAPQQTSVFSGWTYNSPWITNYLAFDAANNSVNQLFDGAMTAVSYGGPTQAYAGAIAEGTYDDIRLGARDNPTILSHFAYVVATTTTFQFAIPDNGVSDNGGGVSVLISTVPEPVGLAIVFPALAALVTRRRR
jgi:hypothetical protein